MKIGAQLYTMRDFLQTERDMEYTLQKISEIGYDTVQISGVGPVDPKVIRKLCDKNELKIVLTHTPQDKILNATDKVIEEHNILGADYIGIGSMPGKYRDPAFVHRFAADYKEAAIKMKKAGKLFMYHNHAFEWQKIDGKRIIDILVDSFEPDEMGFTLDTYWVQAAGADIITWIEKLQDRIPCVHLKDMGIVDFTPVMEAVGEGNINFEPIMAKLAELNKTKYALVEQDRCNGMSPFKAMELSYNNLKKMGY
ncbi:MAG: sugar phosphate isomerase/epimerase [Clostridia bacterium]